MVKTILNEDKSNVNTFELILQGNPINTLMSIQNKNLAIDNFTHSAEISINGVRITISNYANCKIDTTVFRFLDYLLIKMCKHLPYDRTNFISDDKISQWQAIKISVADYMKMTDLSNQTRTKKQIENSLITLQNINLSWTEKIYKKKKADYILFNSNIITAFKPVRGGYYIQFDLRFLRYLSSYSYIMPFSMELFKINLKHNPNSYLIARRLLLHMNMNQTKSNANVISVKNLLEVTDIPSYRDVVNSNNRGVKRLIITPFEKSMDYLKEVKFLEDWNYDKSSSTANYKDWSKSNITYIIKSYPYKDKNK